MNGASIIMPRARSVSGSAGFGLVELMIALVLGLLVVAAAMGIFIANRQTYTVTESLGRVQENVRFAFELMARDIREAGGNPCGRHVPVVNVVTDSDANWWININSTQDPVTGDLINPWNNSLRAFGTDEAIDGLPFGNGAGQRLDGTEAIQLVSAGGEVSSVELHEPSATSLTLASADHEFEAGNILVVCDARQASVFQASAVAGDSVMHSTGGMANNCTDNLGLPPTCAGATEYTYQPNAMLARLEGSRWYVGSNGRGSTSLFHASTDATGSIGAAQEIVEGVSALQFEFLIDGAYQATAAVAGPADWSRATAVRVTMDLLGEPNAGTTDGQPLRRTLSHVVTLRGRNP